MKCRSPFRSKYAHATCILLAGLFLVESYTLFAQAPDPILDVAASGGAMVGDKSKSERTLKTPKLLPGTEENAVFFPSSTAVTVPFNDQDPLFIQGPCTWMMRCKIKQVASDDGYLLAGRWEGREDRRIMMLGLARKTGQPSLQVSSVGGLDARGVVKLKSQVPENAWVTIVGRFDPGVELAVQLFDEKDELLDSTVISSKVPGVLPDFPLPFILGRGVPSEMEFARFRAWNSALSDEDIKTAVAEK